MFTKLLLFSWLLPVKDNFLGCLYRHGYNLLIEPFDILYFPYAIFKVQGFGSIINKIPKSVLTEDLSVI